MQGRSEGGASIESLKSIYTVLLTTKMGCGNIVYESAAKSVLSHLDIVQAHALGVALTSQVCSKLFQLKQVKCNCGYAENS